MLPLSIVLCWHPAQQDKVDMKVKAGKKKKKLEQKKELPATLCPLLLLLLKFKKMQKKPFAAKKLIKLTKATGYENACDM